MWYVHIITCISICIYMVCVYYYMYIYMYLYIYLYTCMSTRNQLDLHHSWK